MGVQSHESDERRPGRLAGGVLWGLGGLLLACVVGVGVLTLWGGGLPGLGTKGMPPPFGEVPDFTLLERSGRSLTKTDLLGKVWIVDFIFTTCVDACPLVSSRMAKLQAVFASEADVRLVSITVDPEHDTPEVLTRYAASFGAHPQRWLFLTGEKASIYRLAREGFHLGVFDPNDARTGEQKSASGLSPASSTISGRSTGDPFVVRSTSQSAAVPLLPRVRRAAQGLLQILEPTPALAHHGRQQQQGARQAVQHSARFVLVDRRGQIRQYYDSGDENALRRLSHHVTLLLREH